MKTNKKAKSEEEIEAEILKAKKSLQKMQEEIAPFIKRRKIKANSTVGKWCESSICQFGNIVKPYRNHVSDRACDGNSYPLYIDEC